MLFILFWFYYFNVMQHMHLCLSLNCTTGGQVPESQGSTFICVTCWRLLQTDHRLQPLLLSRHCSSKYSGGDQKPLSWPNHVRHFDTYQIQYHLSHAPVLDISFVPCSIRSEFAVNKLKKSGCKGGTFLLRQSPNNYDNFFLTVCVQVKFPTEAT